MANFDTTTTFQPGQYWIGDPCYVMHAEWSELCTQLFFAGRTDFGANDGEYTMKNGHKIFIASTAYGDGEYSDNRGNRYGVDAGCIGIIPLTAIDQSNKENDIKHGKVFTFNTEFEVSASGGVFHFENIVIDTTDDGYDDEEEYADDAGIILHDYEDDGWDIR